MHASRLCRGLCTCGHGNVQAHDTRTHSSLFFSVWRSGSSTLRRDTAGAPLLSSARPEQSLEKQSLRPHALLWSERESNTGHAERHEAAAGGSGRTSARGGGRCPAGFACRCRRSGVRSLLQGWAVSNERAGGGARSGTHGVDRDASRRISYSEGARCALPESCHGVCFPRMPQRLDAAAGARHCLTPLGRAPEHNLPIVARADKKMRPRWREKCDTTNCGAMHALRLAKNRDAPTWRYLGVLCSWHSAGSACPGCRVGLSIGRQLHRCGCDVGIKKADAPVAAGSCQPAHRQRRRLQSFRGNLAGVLDLRLACLQMGFGHKSEDAVPATASSTATTG